MDSLQQNVQQLKNALSQTPSAGAGPAGSVGTPGAAGSAGTPGAAGSAGTPGAAGSAGAAGATGATGATGAAGNSASPSAAGATGSAGIAGAPGASGAPGSAGTAGAGAPVAPGSSSSGGSTTAATSQNAQSTLTQLWSKFSTSAVGLLTAILAIGGLLVAWLLRRASARRELDQVEGDDSPAPLNPSARAALDQKLQGIDLNLDMTSSAVKKEPSIIQPNSGSKV